jgi:hypothetical protein
MWLYFIERGNEKVVILSNHLLLDMTRETQEALEKFNIRYTLSHLYVEDFECAKQVWKKGGYEIASIDWLAELVKGWHCGVEDRTEQQPLLKYEDVFSKHPKTTRERKEEVEDKTPFKSTKPAPFQKWVWSKKNFAEGTVEMIIEEVLKQGLFVEFLTSELGRELMSYYGEALRDLVRKKIREL